MNMTEWTSYPVGGVLQAAFQAGFSSFLAGQGSVPMSWWRCRSLLSHAQRPHTTAHPSSLPTMAAAPQADVRPPTPPTPPVPQPGMATICSLYSTRTRWPSSLGRQVNAQGRSTDSHHNANKAAAGEQQLPRQSPCSTQGPTQALHLHQPQLAVPGPHRQISTPPCCSSGKR